VRPAAQGQPEFQHPACRPPPQFAQCGPRQAAEQAAWEAGEHHLWGQQRNGIARGRDGYPAHLPETPHREEPQLPGTQCRRPELSEYIHQMRYRRVLVGGARDRIGLGCIM